MYLQVALVSQHGVISVQHTKARAGWGRGEASGKRGGRAGSSAAGAAAAVEQLLPGAFPLPLGASPTATWQRVSKPASAPTSSHRAGGQPALKHRAKLG